MSAQNVPLENLGDRVLAHINPNFFNAGNRFLPGQISNPHGRPTFKIMSDALYRKLQVQTNPETGETKADEIADAIVEVARKGDVAAFCAIRDTTDGRPAQQINLDGNLLLESADERKQRMLAVLTALAGLSEEP